MHKTPTSKVIQSYCITQHHNYMYLNGLYSPNTGVNLHQGEEEYPKTLFSPHYRNSFCSFGSGLWDASASSHLASVILGQHPCTNFKM